MYIDFESSQGRASISEALLKVDAAIEEIDILDLQTYLAQTQRSDIQQALPKADRGSRNHLNAFASTLKIQTGEEYTPQYLSLDEYNEILSAPVGQSRAGQGYHGGQGGYGGNRNP